ncbi:MAG: glycosyl hydrolase family 28 protein [Candidatus Methylacidiphilales bacterium]|nr:glycosyl hydrolase family 28 protein [Candidatus Methylacidiphilales bacterium]
MMVDMRRPRMVGHAVIPSGKKVLLKIVTNHPADQAEIRPAQPKLLRKNKDGSLRLTLSANESATLQFLNDPGICLHLNVRPGKWATTTRPQKNVLHYKPGFHVIPGGVLKLQSNQTLQLDDGAVLRGRLECSGVENVLIRGLGVIDLLADCPPDPRNEIAPKAPALKIVHSRNVRVEGVTLRNPSHYGVMLGQSKNIHINHVSIFTHCLWGDGIDSMSCSDLRVAHCFIRSSDDCLAVYADRGEFKGSVRRHHYSHCTLWADVAHPVMVGVHGQQKSPGRNIEKLRFEHLTILRHCEPSPMYQGCLALNPGDWNIIRNVHFTNIRIEDSDAPRLLDLRVLFNPAYNPVPGKTIQDIHFNRISYRGDPEIPSVIEGFDRHRWVKNVSVKQLCINGIRQKSIPNLRTNQWATLPKVG